MEILFLICAGLGGTLMLCQFFASLLGLGGDHGDADHGHFGDAHGDHDVHGHDTDHDHDNASSWFFGMLSFRALTAALTFFGLSGLASLQGGLEAPHALLIGLASAAVAVYVVASMMRLLARLKADGSVRIDRAVGQLGTVYLKIPGQKAGAGKVTLVLQNRTVECPAITAQHELPTGTRIRVVALVGPDTLEVIPATMESPTHV